MNLEAAQKSVVAPPVVPSAAVCSQAAATCSQAAAICSQTAAVCSRVATLRIQTATVRIQAATCEVAERIEGEDGGSAQQLGRR